MRTKLASKTYRWLVMALTVALLLQVAAGAFAAEQGSTNTAPNHLLIHQVYGGGGKSDTPFTHSFIELYNPTAEAIDLTGWTLQYASSRGTQHLGSTGGQWVTLNLAGSVAAGHSFLIRGAAETTNVSKYDINTFDQEWEGRYIDNDQYNVRLVDTVGTVDQVTVKEAGLDGGEGTPIPEISKQRSVRRIAFKDVNDNATDFEVLIFNDSAVDAAFVNRYRPRSLTDGAWTQEDGAGEPGPNPEPQPEPSSIIIGSINKQIAHLGSYATGFQDADGAVAEIVAFNPDNRKMYIVNGKLKQVDIVSLANLHGGNNSFTLDKRIDVSTMIEGFAFGDLTSIDVDTSRRLIAVAVQEQDYSKPGAVVLLDYDGNYQAHYKVGVQPDMVTFTPDGNYVLTADEGEPRNGYGNNAVDPKGSVSIINLKNGLTEAEVVIATFDAFNGEEARAQLVTDKVILKKNTAPSVDLEPEYVAVASNSLTAYVSLQEANAIATLDIATGTFTSVKGLGFKNHNLEGNELDLLRNSTLEIKNQDVYGVYMPDGLAVAEIGGKTYVLTPNEGDAREWNGYKNITEATIDDRKFDVLINNEHDGLDADKTYVLGGRSFSIWDAATMELVFDSGSDFEKKTAEWLPDYFNVSNDNLTMDHRSSKKGPEPEDVKVTQIGDKFYAAIGLERFGGVMLYDISDPENAVFHDYINTRDYTAAIRGDVSPEGLAFVAAEHSPTGYPLLLAAHEVSGTVAVYQINEGYVEPRDIMPFALDVDKTAVDGMSAYTYTVRAGEGAATYTEPFYVVVQVYEGTNHATPGLVLIKRMHAGTAPVTEEIRIGAQKKVKIMVVSSVDAPDSRVLADAYGVE